MTIEETINGLQSMIQSKKFIEHNFDGVVDEDVCERAIELLKEQKTELSYRNAKTITHTATKLDDATCPSCGNVVGEKIRIEAIRQSVVQVRWDYCRFCGQKLDWEGL